MLSKDKEEKIDLCGRELGLKKKKLELVRQEADRLEVKIDSQKEERKAVEEKLAEGEGFVGKSKVEFDGEERKLVGFEKKLQEELVRVVRVKLRERVDSYKFEIYRSKVFK